MSIAFPHADLNSKMLTRSSETYNLKLDQACIFLRDASSACVNGTVHINLRQSDSFKGIRVQLLGVLKVPQASFIIQNDRQHITFISEQSIGSSKCLSSFHLAAGNYRFPFSLPLSARMLETVTCQRHAYHTYRVQAIIERRFRSNSTISRPIRLHNYPDPSIDYQLISPPTVERQLDQDLQYSISLPDSNIPFASKFPVKCCFSPLSKNLKLDTVSISILEKHNLRVDATAAESAMHNVHTITTSGTSIIFQSEYNPFDQTPEISATGASMPSADWSLSLPVQLPESFSLASQSVSTRVIQVTHDILLQAKFHNTETHTPVTIEERIPFSIYMTPAVIEEDGTIHGKHIESFKAYDCAPPVYGHHNCDAVPPEWAEYLRQSSMSSRQQSHPTAQGPPDNEPPAYQFFST